MQTKTKAYIALIFICLIWGTTYLAIGSSVKTFPPLLFAASRQLTAGIILLLLVFLFSKKIHWRAKNVRRQMIAGFLMITLGNGLVCWACQYVPSGLAALLGAITPACTIFMSLSTEKDFKLNSPILLGMLSGLLGIVAIFGENIKDLANPNYLLGMVAIFIAILAWAYGGIYGRVGASANDNSFANAGIQLATGGFFQLVWSGLFEDWTNVPPLTNQLLWTLAYLIVFGSILAFVAYLYAMSKLSPGVVSIYAYINPLVAVLLGWWVLNEKLTPITGLAFLLVLLGVYGINKGYKIQAVPQPIPQKEEELVEAP